MLSKIMAGGLVAAALALFVVFNLLLDAKEANGTLVANIDRVASANARQVTAIEFLKRKNLELIAQVKQREKRAFEASEALMATELARERELNQFQDRLATIREKLTDAEIVCADALVPAALIDSLHDD